MRRNTAAYSKRISDRLAHLGIKHEVMTHEFDDDIITVDRTSMVHANSGVGEDAAYTHTLTQIRLACADENTYVCWSMRTDDWLSVEVYLRDPA